MPETSPTSAGEPAVRPAAGTGPRGRAPYPGLAAALARDAALKARRKAEDTACGTAAYRLLLRGPLPDRLALHPDALTPASLERAQDILRGRFALASGIVDVRDCSPFDAPGPDAWRAEIHRFEWLAHLEKAGGATAAYVGRALTEDWLDRHERFDAFAWRPEILGPRLVAWAAHFRFLNASNDLVFRSRLMKALAEQARHLERYARTAPPGLALLEAASALCVMSAALPEGEKRPLRAVEALREALNSGLLDDGGIVTRAPHEQALAVAALARAQRALADARRPQPPDLAAALEAARTCLGRLMHGDGRLACFNGSGEGDEPWLAELRDAAASETGPARPANWGYARLSAASALVLFDCGGPPPGPHAAEAHAGPLAFELSHRSARIVVNGGTARARGVEWREAARRTAAHATLQLNDQDAGSLLSGAAGARLGPLLYGGRAQGSLEMGAEGQWAEGTHDLYRRSFGAVHRRRLFLNATGDDLRGEDRLTFPAQRVWCEAVIRFPLHPDCKATLAQSGDSVLIVPHDGEAWRFRTELVGLNEKLALEPHAYMGGETVRTAQAIVIRAMPAGREWTMRWAFKIEAPYKRTRRRLV
ncbi:MAG: heparinase II/III family protein [Alphaproteobacteria bacterium]|nr:heparinase II/III family protein [Alphaproteobacteria bacterium]